ncbi:MAG: Hsp70 family protein, partial [Alphaproteobacteria bacterium]|nr:Hsp70 family protein [Alphaproteobacteria bacterium]
ASGGLDDGEIERMVKDAESNAETDKKKRELADAKNNGESMMHACEKTMGELGEKLDAAEKENIETTIKELREALEGDNLALIQDKTNQLTQSSMKMGEMLYKQAEAQAGDNAEAEAPQTDDNVVDADFEEVDDNKKDDK